MPCLDKPLEELKVYQGINPKPADFDEFWDKSIAEMKAVDPQIELIPADFQVEHAECFHLYFTGTGGARVHAKYVRPKGATTPHPAVLAFHGYTSRSCQWSDMLNWVSAGYSIAYLDCRGQSGLSEDSGTTSGNTHHGHIIRGLNDKPEDLLFRHIFLDTAKIAEIVMSFPEVDETRVGAFGGSQGGGLTLSCAALEPNIKLAAPVFPFLCDYKRVWEMDLAKKAYEELGYFFRIYDPRHEREEEIFTKLGYIDLQYLAPRIKAKTLFFTGLVDDVCPPSTQFAAYNKMTCEKELVVYPDYGHEDLPDKNDMTFNFMLGL